MNLPLPHTPGLHSAPPSMDPAAAPADHAAAGALPQPQRLPLYLQISELLVREIAAGRWQPGDRLPTEAALASRLGVAVGTLRKALAELQARGLLQRRQGSGTYLRQAEGQRSIYGFFRLERADGGGGLPTADVLAFDRIMRPTGLPALGGAPDGAPQPVWRVRRLRHLDHQPVALEDICFDARGREALSVADLHESLYHFYAQRLGFWIAQVDDQIGLGTVPDWTDTAPHAGRLGPGLQPGQPAVQVVRRAWSQHGVLAEVSSTWFDSRVARYGARWR